MSWRIVAITSRAKLDYKMNYLVVRTSEETKRININEISVLIIESTGVSLTAYLLSELIKSKLYVLFCDEKRLPHMLFAIKTYARSVFDVLLLEGHQCPYRVDVEKVRIIDSDLCELY